MKAFHRKRLEKLADFLRTVKRKKFNISDWIATKEGQIQCIVGEEDLKDCGTVACAVGWACTIPSFKKAGLKLNGYRPTFKNNWDFYAAVEFFGLKYNETQYLFSGYEYKVQFEKVTPIMVSNRIKKFLKDGLIHTMD